MSGRAFARWEAVRWRVIAEDIEQFSALLSL
jgi:hypothetical protein